ncbi:FAD-dependent oxidoreductase, partial [Porticoccaceae bacterium]|nr:FAD-dependent oxidoreductase [Porticoccaceae bacterium]
LVSRYLNNKSVDWEREYAAELMVGVDTFRAYVNAWYDGSLQDIIFTGNGSPNIREMVCSILAGYAWDTSNPFVQEPKRRLSALAKICATV